MNTIAPSPAGYPLGAQESELSRRLLQAEIHRPEAAELTRAERSPCAR